MELDRIRRILLDEGSPDGLVEAALDRYSRICEEVTGITPDAGLGAWAEDSLLDGGIAINPRAAANCVADHRRTLVFVRAVHAALTKLLASRATEAVDVLYAGCGPWATLLLPVLGDFPAPRLRVQLLDMHGSALEAVHRLIAHFGLADHVIDSQLADASVWRCARPPQLIIAETMHKALEQEPQFAVTANLAPQLAPGGIFLPERIDVDLCLTRRVGRLSLGRVMSLSAEHCQAPAPVELRVPADAALDAARAELITSIRVFGHHRLRPGEAHITGARPCPELAPLSAGTICRVAFRPGSYPIFELTREAPDPGPAASRNASAHRN